MLCCRKDAGCHGYQIAISLGGSWFIIKLITHIFNTVCPQQKPYIDPRFLHRAAKQIHVKKVSFESESCACNGADFESFWPCCASWRLECSSLASTSLDNVDRSQKDIDRSEGPFRGSGLLCWENIFILIQVAQRSSNTHCQQAPPQGTIPQNRLHTNQSPGGVSRALLLH